MGNLNSCDNWVACQPVVLRNRDRSHPEETVEISGFVAMGLNLDAATKNLNELFPFQFFWEGTKALPFSSQGFLAVRVLGFLDLSSLIVPINPSE